MANKSIYDGTPGPISGSTNFGYYDSDVQFQIDGPKVANFCARKLGWPIMDVELDDQNLWPVFNMETKLFPCLVDMRFKGVRVDVEKAEKIKKNLINEEK